VTVTGGTLTATGDYFSGIVSYGGVAVSAGTVKATGTSSGDPDSPIAAIYAINDIAEVTGGTVQGTDYDLYIGGDGAGIYLAGVCRDGYVGVRTAEEGDDSTAGVIVKADSLTIPAADVGTDKGLTVMASAYFDIGGLTAAWGSENGAPVIQLKAGDTDLWQIAWGEFSSAPPSNPFTDVSADDWFAGDVQYVYDSGLMTGTADDTFSPFTNTSRGMIVTILYRLDGGPDVSGLDNPFTDVPNDMYYAGAVIWAAENNIVTGRGDGTFGPNDSVSRQDLAVMLARYADCLDVTLPAVKAAPSFTDDASVADYARDAVSLLSGAGVINGRDNGSFDPAGLAARAEVAAMLHRFVPLVAMG